MFTSNMGRNIVIAAALTALCAGVCAAAKVYKWVDEDGVVHFSDTPPDEAKSADSETLIIPKTPASAIPAEPAAKPVAVAAAVEENQTPTPAAAIAAPAEKIDITSMSIADLNLRCEDAREKAIAPLREAEIATCKQNKSNDPAWCERFNADYGDGGRTASGSIRPRMFDDLPECVEALQENNRRGR